MSWNLLEVTRGAHEEVERLERLIVKHLQNDHPASSSSKDRLSQSHRLRNMIDTVISTTHRLIDIYEDEDSAMKDEIAALGGGCSTATGGANSAFYDRLRKIREYHGNHPAAAAAHIIDDANEALQPVIEFTGEESFGKYLDLHELYNQYINSKFREQHIEYTAYLDVFSQPQQKLKSTTRRQYMENLLEYLVSFFQRTEPLQDLDRIFLKVAAEFKEQWGTRKADVLIDLDCYTSAEELLEVGPEKLKEALAALGLKTGGTVLQRAERLFLTKHTSLENLDKKHFTKASGESEHIALMEAKVQKLCDLLKEVIVRTKENAVKKQGLTYNEMEAERGEEEKETQADDNTESDDDGEQKKIYNPLKLPMGWDGKPIPMWLYKLHGLGEEFKCEICGDCSYRGRRAFEGHFKEGRHQHGMRCLGIPNNKDFNEITSIQEARDLWKKIQEGQGVKRWRPDVEEEYEDEEGNIYNKKTHTELKRQRLI